MELHFAIDVHRATRALAVAGVVTLAFLLAGCGGAGSKPGLVLDRQGKSAVELYDEGTGRLLAGDEEGAEWAFREALDVAGRSGLDFAPPHEGLARVFLRRNNVDDAESEATRALELDRYWAPGYWVMGQIEERRKNDEDALARYEHGLSVAPGDRELTAAAADLLRRLGRNADADALEERTRRMEAERRRRMPDRGEGTPGSARGERGGADTLAALPDSTGPAGMDEARARLEPFFADKVRTLSPALLAVFTQPVLTRGALAVLITGDGTHGLSGALGRSMGSVEGTSHPPRDVDGRPEESWIDQALAMGLMEPFPDGSFRPDQPMTRLTMALWIEETIARLRNDHRIFQLYRGQKSPFSDLPDGHYALNAARIAVDLKLLPPRDGGRFAPEDPVEMREGISAVRGLGPALMGETGAGQ